MQKTFKSLKNLTSRSNVNPANITTIIVHTSELFRRPLEGRILPATMLGLKDFLASDLGEIHFRFEGRGSLALGGNANGKADKSPAGKNPNNQGTSEKRQLTCIISGWFEVYDALTLQPTKFTCDIKSRLIMVSSEADLPPLDEESDDEDYVVSEVEFDVLERVQEEILLCLPLNLPLNVAPSSSATKSRAFKNSNQRALTDDGALAPSTVKPSPFAKLAALKKIADTSIT